VAEWGPAHCGCGCRPPGCGPGCPCKQCQPGPGINFLRGMSRRARRNADLIAAGQFEDVRWVFSVKIEDDKG